MRLFTSYLRGFSRMGTIPSNKLTPVLFVAQLENYPVLTDKSKKHHLLAVLIE